MFLLAAGFSIHNLQAQRLWTSEFRDSAGWNQSKYGTTIMYGDLNGDGRIDVCGRGAAGIYCSLSTGSSFVGVAFNEGIFASADFSDQGGWGDAIYYSSLRLGDINGDGKADVCGRGAYGIMCAIGKGDGTFESAQLWTSDYADNWWRWLQYGSTIMLGDLNGDGRDDICARGGSGIYCALSTGSGFSNSYYASWDFADNWGWTNPIYYTSLRLADVNGDGIADVCGRGIWGITCALGKGNGYFNTAQSWENFFSNANGWDQLSRTSTIMYGDINGDGMDDVCSRGPSGMYCEISTGSSFRPVQILTSDFADSEGWSVRDYYYGSLRLADINGDGQADVCGRGGDGIECALAVVRFQ